MIDRLGKTAQAYERSESNLVCFAFGSTLQGDHCGVDIATEAHTQMLQTHGLLGSEVQLAANSLGVGRQKFKAGH